MRNETHKSPHFLLYKAQLENCGIHKRVNDSFHLWMGGLLADSSSRVWRGDWSGVADAPCPLPLERSVCVEMGGVEMGGGRGYTFERL